VFLLVLSNKNQEETDKKGMSRWISLTAGIVLFFIAFLKGELITAFLTFAIGALCGFVIDCIGVGILKLWKYPRQEFLKKEYFGIVVPAWGVFGMLINLPLNWIPMPDALSFTMITVSLLVFYELPNIRIGSWKYNVPTWIVISGWFPLILANRFLFLSFSY